MEESLIHFETDIDCRVYKFGNFLCEVNRGKDVCTPFRKGSFKLKFVSSSNPVDFYETIYNINEAGIETFYTITLKPIQDKRLQDEQKERDRLLSLQRKAEQEQKELERLRVEKQRKEDALKLARSQFVDLGLSVKWSTCNLGAISPENYGAFYAWGETSGKTSFGNGLYKHFKPGKDYTQYESVLKYNNYKITDDHKTRLDSIDDAATSYLGQGYRIPTAQEWEELRSKCTFEKTLLNGVEGYLVKSKNMIYKNNSIFLPLVGVYSWRGHSYNMSIYWTCELSERISYGFNEGAKVFILKHSSPSVQDLTIEWMPRSWGFPIRPVCDI